MSSNPDTIYNDGNFSHLFVVKIVMCVWKDENKHEKEAAVGPFKKVSKDSFRYRSAKNK